MEKRVVSKEQVKYLHEFAKKKDIDLIDLRIELVDHLCSSIESLWEKNPELSFKSAFHKVYKSYGIFGFLSIAEQHQKIMTKRYRMELWSHLRSFFKPPLVFAVMLSTFILFQITSTQPWGGMIGLSLFTGLALFSVISSIIFFFKSKRVLKERNVLTSGVQNGIHYSFIIIFQFPAIRSINEHFKSYGEDVNPYFITAVTIALALFFIANYQVYLKGKQQLLDIKARMVW